METTIEVDEVTMIRVTLVGFSKWQVTVGQMLMQPEVKKISRYEQDLRFVMPDGRNAMVTVRPYGGFKPVFDAQVGGHEIIDPGPWPFKCPQCRKTVRPRDQLCTSCGAPQPSPTARAKNRGRRSAARGLWLRSLFWSVMLVLYISAHRSTIDSALGSLESTQSPDDVGLTPEESVGFVLTLAVFGIIVTAACAPLARRFPATAHWISTGFALIAFLWYCAACGVTTGLLLCSPLVIWGMARAARLARGSQRALFSS